MRNRRDDDRNFRGSGDERSWNRDEDMGGSRWSGTSGRGGYESRDRDREREGGFGGGWGGQREHSGLNMYGGHEREDRQWGRDRDRYDDDFDDRPRNLGARDYETRHIARFDRGAYEARGEGGFRSELGGRGIGGRIAGERGEHDFGGGVGDRGYRGRELGWGGGERGGWRGGQGGEIRTRHDFDEQPLGGGGMSGRGYGDMLEGRGGYGGSTSYGAYGGSYGMGGYGGYGGSGGFGGQSGVGGYGGRGGMMGRQNVLGGRGGGMRGEGWGQRMGGSDLGFSYGEHEGMDDLESRGPHYGKGPKGYKRSDDRIREDVCDAIAQQGNIDASDVEVKVENGTVILTGTVAQRHHKRSLEQMVERLHGVDDVRNELRLKRDEPQETSRMQSGMQTTSTSPNGDQARSSSGYPNGKPART